MSADVGWDLVSGGDTLSLIGRAGEAFWFEVLADGWDLGSPEAVRAVFSSIAADGDDERITRHGNRTVPFQVKVCAPDLDGVAAGERALRLMLNRAPDLELRYTPPDGYGEITVFDVLLGEMPEVADDMALLRSNPWSTYAVSLRCRPFVRPLNPVTTSLTYGTDAGTSLDDGSSTTGWSSSDGTLSAVTVNTETAVKLTVTPAFTNSSKTLTRAALALTSAKPYLAVDVAATTSGDTRNWQADVRVSLGTTLLAAPVAAVPQSTGFTRYFFAHSAAGTTKDVAVTIYAGANALSDVYVGNLRAYSTAPGSGLMIADVEGSERAPMTVKVSHSTSGALGAFVVYSDPTMLEYGWNPADSTTWPNAPAGPYVLLNPIVGVGGTLYDVTLNGETSYCMGGLAGALWFDFQFGGRRDGRIGPITGTPPANSLLFRDVPGETSLVHLTSVTGRYLFLDSPTIETPRIGVWSGDVSDGSDAVSQLTYAEALDALTVKPPRYALFLKSTDPSPVTNFSADLTYYPLSHTFVPSPGLVS